MLCFARAKSVDFKPGDGLKVIARGCYIRIRKYGRYQFYVEEMDRTGWAACFYHWPSSGAPGKGGAFRSTAQTSHPSFRKLLRVVTSSDGSSFEDIIRVVRQRHSGCHIVVAPAAVQGRRRRMRSPDRSTPSISGQPDVIIVGRGGVLWRTSGLSIPKGGKGYRSVTDTGHFGVGHEIDFSLADLAADVRRHATEAAQMAVPDMLAYQEQLTATGLRLRRIMERSCNQRWAQLTTFGKEGYGKSRSPYLNPTQGTATYLAGPAAPYDEYSNARSSSLKQLAVTLDAISPLKVLERGYAIARTEDGDVVRSIRQVKPNSLLNLTVRNGEIKAEVREIRRGDWCDEF